MKRVLIITVGALTWAAFAFAAGDAATLELISDEGWCTVYIDGNEVGEIPLNGHNVVIRNVAPGSHHVRITDAFDAVWFEDVVAFAKGATVRAKVEPSGLTLIDKGAGPPEPPPGAPNQPPVPVTKVRVDFLPYKQAPTMFYVTSTPAAVAVKVDGRDAGVTPLLKTDLGAGKHMVNVGGLDEEVDLKVAGITKMDVTFAAPPGGAPADVKVDALGMPMVEIHMK